LVWVRFVVAQLDTDNDANLQVPTPSPQITSEDGRQRSARRGVPSQVARPIAVSMSTGVNTPRDRSSVTTSRMMQLYEVMLPGTPRL
jgi:hypothetical protein